MRIIFLGTPDFAVETLDRIMQDGYEIVGVVTVPDKPSGRGQQLTMSAVKKYALEKNLKILQPTNLKDPGFITQLKELKADLQVVVAFRMLPEVVWNMPPLGTYNLHASLLPKYRGAAPINWAIINGETETGITTFKLKHEIDTGNILLQQKVPITESETAGSLHDKLKIAGANLVIETLKVIEKSVLSAESLKFKQQDDSLASHAPKLSRETCRINWKRTNKEIYNLIRGLCPYPSAFTSVSLNGKEASVKILAAKIYNGPGSDLPNGSLITDNKTYLRVVCGTGFLDILELQLEGRKRLDTEEFLRGYRFPGTTFFS
jgi:methionyl-tRNA formyltransferase